MNPIQIAHDFLKQVIHQGDIVVDATMGNGHDTVFLASQGAKVFAFDVQDLAITNTGKLLSQNNLSATLLKDGHENLDKYIDGEIKAAIFNLGYLPRSDKSVITKPDTTIMALKKLCGKLSPNGRIAIVVYPGHTGGDSEAVEVEKFVSSLGQNWDVKIEKPLAKTTSPYAVLLKKY
ncbi:MAG: class I SAM-dependent methyltransferase [Firmicutes bacterium]|nr:class I SAM-dependent methyltransferase [Bacillota bacterium]